MASFSNPLDRQHHHSNQSPISPALYWHHLMIRNRKPSTYTSKAIQERVTEISNRLGHNSLSSPQGEHGFTPMHVAAITGNAPGMSFLLNNKASLEEKDQRGKTAFQYLREYHPELVPQFLPNESLTAKDLIDCLPRVQLSNAPCLYKENTDDFGVVINTLLFNKPDNDCPEDQEYYKKTGIQIRDAMLNLKPIFKKLGIHLETACGYMPRDHWIALPKGGFALPDDSPSAKTAIDRNESLKLLQQKSASALTSHEYFMMSPGLVLKKNVLAAQDFKKKFDNPLALQFYMEGGNLFRGKKLIIGEDILRTAHLQFRLDKFFDKLEPRVKLMAKLAAPLLTDTEISETIQEMYALGLLKHPKEGKGLLSKKEQEWLCFQCTLKGPNNYMQAAQDLGFFTPLQLNAAQIQEHRPIAANYHTQRVITKTMIGKSFSVDPEDIVIIPQADYHLDVFMRPGPKNSFFVQDYGCVISLLTTIKSRAKALQLSIQDLHMLDRYLQAAQELDQQLKPLFDITKRELSKAGFTVIPTPGVFYDISPKILSPDYPPDAITYNLNFINGISGFSPKTQRYFYITTGAQVGDRLGGIIMDTFKEFLCSYQKDLDVFYVGHDPQNPTTFQESMRWGNYLGAQFGIHCLSVATNTQSHLDSPHLNIASDENKNNCVK